MPVRNSVLTGALLAGTVAAAAGLNLAVMGLGRTEATVAPSMDDGAATAPTDAQVELTSTEVDPGPAALAPVLAVGLTAPGQGAAPGTAAAAADPPSVTPAPTTAVTTSPSDPAPITTGGEPSASVEPSSAAAMPASPVGAAPTSLSTNGASASPTTSGHATTATSPSTVPVSTEYLTYEFEGVASIVVALHDGRRLEFWSVTAEDGWAFLVEDRGPTKVKIKFRPARGGDEAEFELTFDDGRLKAKREY